MVAKNLGIESARRKIASLDRDLRTRRVIYVTKGGKRAFAVVDPDYLDSLHETLAILSDPAAVRLLRRSSRAARKGRLIPQDEVEKELL